jgi:hypothetical protein
VIKHNFDQTPKLLETFDQLIRSSEIRSTDPLSVDVLTTFYRIYEIQMTISTLLHAIISILRYSVAMTSQILIAFIKFPMTGK